ncbi:MAG: rubrerythrin family protein, partial [Thermoplasmata archaeon]|nr:rubrerythrin family protein [Thermoplasmata archaeon]NIS14036.1 rubrerythrin family protein [Thermoplasmata archaeon]NIS21869.1 rubrerythrin family protein [Thermoplasmata archaeon]NIT79473.1 rubrerythrin family protein [Thermoplasmata archaeon]NIU50904.1 rubrerythrin family protein [Thermoplasmata archaeon]
LQGGMVEIQAAYPAGVIGTTAENLKASAEGENEEWTELYPSFADIADEEGFPQIAATWRMIAKAEERHEARYLYYLKQVEEGTFFLRDAPTRWKCGNCGYVHDGTEAPQMCPACLHPQTYFEEYLVKY